MSPARSNRLPSERMPSGVAVVMASTACRGAVNAVMAEGNETRRTILPTMAGFAKFCPRPPKNCFVTTMAKNNDALIAINGGGFDDPNFNSNGASPLGITISDGKVVTSKSYGGSGGLIGFTEDDKLVLGKMTVKQAQQMKIRDAVTFGPFLIINGKASAVLGNGGWGTAPRTVIGQRKDGIVLFLVIDGRTVSKPGADMNDLIEIMQNYGAYNAANLDGGTSSVMVVDGEIINDPVDSSGAHRTRYISTGFILTKEEE